ncbi:MAG: 4-hydroxythreonine-4-phosphate dehydrogenase PdxA [Hyphomicrobiaceae bacterium]|nr:4-hydroxythreonine-4-phosphate dehydrogenase PdxA [Hyphomicrobiaceae bacterium]
MTFKTSQRNELPIAITMGDPAGISTEISALSWRETRKERRSTFFVLSRASLFEKYNSSTSQKIAFEIIQSPEEAFAVFPRALPILELPKQVVAIPGQPDPANGEMIIKSISIAVDLVQSKQVSSLVTTPINKHVLYQAGFEFPGHTEYLAKLAMQGNEPASRPVMMLVSSQLRTVPLTIHVPLADVPKMITKQIIEETAHIISADMKKYFGLSSPHIAVAGLNPHAGESGSMGKTEIEIIEPAICELKTQGLNISGPHPADTLFHAKARKNYDVVLGMYHDQALIPIKTLGFDEGVNTTLGLPFVRTSPDHGTAYDIAGKGLANPQSLMEAIKLAQSMSANLQGAR